MALHMVSNGFDIHGINLLNQATPVRFDLSLIPPQARESHAEYTLDCP